MKRSETLDRFSLVLMGLAIGVFLGGLVQALDLPSWVQGIGSLVILAVSFILAVRSEVARGKERKAEIVAEVRRRSSQG